MGYWGKARALASRARPLRLRLYVVGMGKTGTSTMAAVFGEYRSGHEWDAPRMKQIAGLARAGDLDPARARSELRRRSRRFRLEVDCAHFLTPIVPELSDLYPKANFVVLIRDCFSWMDSLLEHWTRVMQAPAAPAVAGGAANSDVASTWASVSHQLQRGQPSVGLAAALTQAWATTYTRLLADVPASRTLVLRTDDIDTAGLRLAGLCDVDLATLRLGVRKNVAPYRQGVLAAVPSAHVVRSAEQWCAPLMEQYWGPDWRDLVRRVPAWAGQV